MKKENEKTSLKQKKFIKRPRKDVYAKTSLKGIKKRLFKHVYDNITKDFY